MLDLIEALTPGTAGRHEGHEGLGGAADELIGVIVHRTGLGGGAAGDPTR